MIDPLAIEHRISELRPLSESARAILDLLGDPDHSLRDLSGVIECDGPLTIRVLNVANSAAYALPAKIEALDHAIVYLGEKAVVTIALSCSASELFGEGPSGFVAGLWENAVQTAIAARIIAGPAAQRRPGEAGRVAAIEPARAFTGGLIRDVGQSVLWTFLEGGAADLEACIASGRATDVRSAERELTGTDHCEVGARIGEHFELTLSLVNLIRFHHDPELAPPEIRTLVDVVHIADAVTTALRARADDGELESCFDPASAARIGFAMAELDGLCAAMTAEFESARALVSIR